jgi:hypothetical protein
MKENMGGDVSKLYNILVRKPEEKKTIWEIYM